MALETFGYIDDLDPSSPDGATEYVSQGDDHIRGIKLTLQNSFPNLTGAVNATQDELNQLLGTVISAFAKTLLDDVDQAAMHVTLGTQAMIDNSRPFVGSTTLSLGANSNGFVDIANPYGTDDVDFGCEAFGSLDLSSGGMNFIVVMTAPDKRTFTVIGSTIGTPFVGAPPATGYLRITLINVNSAAQDVTAKYWIRRRGA